MSEVNEKMNEKEKVMRTLTGIVTSNKMHQTISVRVERRVQHPKYGKFVRRSSKIHAHDQDNQCQIGDVVTVRECRPMAKTKRWTLMTIDQKAEKFDE